MIFRTLIFMWVVMAQIFLVAALMRLYFYRNRSNALKECGYCLVWPLLIFTAAGRSKLYRLITFR